MKRILTLALAAGLCASAVAPVAQATEFKASGFYLINMQTADNISLVSDNVGYTTAGMESPFNKQSGNFYVVQRVQVNLSMVASESLSGSMVLRTPAYAIWGLGDTTTSSGTGFDIGGSTQVQIKAAYIDWLVPSTDVKVRMGLQSFALPRYASSLNPVLDDFVAGVRVDVPLADMGELTAAWFRLDYSADSGGSMDMFNLMAPLKFDNFEITPWASYVMAGRNSGNYSTDTSFWGTTEFVTTPINYFTNPTSGVNIYYDMPDQSAYGSYGMYWLGLTGAYHMDQFTLRLAALYGGGSYTYNTLTGTSDSSKGWLLDANFLYKHDYGTSSIFAWAASGDDKNGKIGRFQTISGWWGDGLSTFFHNSNFFFTANAGVNSPAGTWGIGLRHIGLPVFEDMKVGAHISYIQGTNAKENASGTFTPHYMTTEDSVVELGAYARYDIYKNLIALLEVGYMIENVDKDIWTGTTKYENGFVTALSFRYNF